MQRQLAIAHPLGQHPFFKVRSIAHVKTGQKIAVIENRGVSQASEAAAVCGPAGLEMVFKLGGIEGVGNGRIPAYGLAGDDQIGFKQFA